MRPEDKNEVACRRRKKRFIGSAGRALALLLAGVLVCACGKVSPESTTSGEETTSPAAETAAVGTAEQSTAAAPAPTDEQTESTEESMPDGAEEDPFAEGYFFDEALTQALFAAFATENTNNTEAASPSRSLTQEALKEMDRCAHAWLYDGVSDTETEARLKQLTFRFPNDPPGTTRSLRSVRAAVYRLGGSDPDTIADRIRLGNTEACFYLFLRAYCSEAENRTRVYMINGLIW